jgi:hypothetical protein
MRQQQGFSVAHADLRAGESWSRGANKAQPPKAESHQHIVIACSDNSTLLRISGWNAPCVELWPVAPSMFE